MGAVWKYAKDFRTSTVVDVLAFVFHYNENKKCYVCYDGCNDTILGDSDLFKAWLSVGVWMWWRDDWWKKWMLRWNEWIMNAHHFFSWLAVHHWDVVSVFVCVCVCDGKYPLFLCVLQHILCSPYFCSKFSVLALKFGIDLNMLRLSGLLTWTAVWFIPPVPMSV